MSEKTFLPTTPLEHSLLKAKSDASSMGQFFTELVRSKVFVLAEKAVRLDNGLDSSINLCVLTNKSGQSVVAAFTAQELATPLHERQPTFRHGLLVDAASLISGLASGVGLVLNPGHPVGVEIPPDAINTLKRELSSNPPAT